jgi:hypothetical protein
VDDLSPVTLRAYRDRLDRQLLLVFPAPLGVWRDPTSTQADLRDAFTAAGFDWVTSHVLRKTVATLMDHAGLSSCAVADQLGHANTSMTTDIYFSRMIAATGARRRPGGIRRRAPVREACSAGATQLNAPRRCAAAACPSGRTGGHRGTGAGALQAGHRHRLQGSDRAGGPPGADDASSTRARSTLSARSGNRSQLIRRKSAAKAWPPPMHMVTTPSSRSRRIRS